MRVVFIIFSGLSKKGRGMKYRCYAIIVMLLVTSHVLLSKTEIIFGPDEKPVSQLVELIGKAKERVYMAIYMLSDQKVTDALIKAHKKNIDVQVIVDPFSFGKYGKANHLIKNEVPLFIYKPIIGGLFEDHMHMKTVLLDKKVWCGSANFSLAGNAKNQEAVIITTEKEVRERVEDRFLLLKEEAISYAQYLEDQLNRPHEFQEDNLSDGNDIIDDNNIADDDDDDIVPESNKDSLLAETIEAEQV